MNLAIVGCGYVAEFYAKTLENYLDLKLVGAFDRDPKNLKLFVERWRVRAFKSVEELVSAMDVDIVVNLTNPRSHYELNKKAIESGKHVYSEKPLAMNVAEAEELRDLAKAKGVYLSSAPCSILSETAQALWKALRENVIGRVRLVYANFDDGMIAPNLSPWNWRNESGVAWPAKDEFEIGCTYEHAGYILTWLAAFFGPALNVTSFASCLIPDKGVNVEKMAPDFVVGCIEYKDGIVARLTCSLVAPKDKSLTIIGDAGVLSIRDVRDDVAPIVLRRNEAAGMRRGFERRVNALRKRFHLHNGGDWKWDEKVRVNRKPRQVFIGLGKQVDFCRGLAELASALKQGRPSRLSADLGVHTVELIEALQYPEPVGGKREIVSRFDPIQPLN